MKKTFTVTVIREAVAELRVRAKSPEEAEEKALEKGLPWGKALEGDTNHHSVEVGEADDEDETDSMPSGED